MVYASAKDEKLLDDGDPKVPKTAPDDSQQSEKTGEMEGVRTRAQVKKKKEDIISKATELTPKMLYPDLELALHYVSPYSVTIDGRHFVRTLASN
jgi:hypothetical protein